MIFLVVSTALVSAAFQVISDSSKALTSRMIRITSSFLTQYERRNTQNFEINARAQSKTPSIVTDRMISVDGDNRAF